MSQVQVLGIPICEVVPVFSAAEIEPGAAGRYLKQPCPPYPIVRAPQL